MKYIHITINDMQNVSIFIKRNPETILNQQLSIAPTFQTLASIFLFLQI